MKANELRIGNTVKDSFGQIGNVINISSKSVSIKHPYSVLKTSYSGINPVELTEDWLMLVGCSECKTKGEFEYMFVADGDDVYRLYIFPFDGKWVIQLYNHYDAENSYDYERVALPIPCHYVHHLQNLYFALTGEELIAR